MSGLSQITHLGDAGICGRRKQGVDGMASGDGVG